ncbi:hypothetical protein SH661x_003002 [Planctomicrobium sp. SH661]|uniref:hypothetical protein n=1 Tax=Planctomicrobium sp. SH661 TaxID=3448124 RepID=UPI003F5C693C
MQKFRISALGALLVGMAGCQCCALTEHYQDTIDHIADRSPHMDNLYCPGLDLTRIGYPDWCQYRFNRWLYGDCCCRDTRQQPPYIHNPMYDLSAGRRPMEPIPEGPMIAPRLDDGPDSNDDGSMPTQLRGVPDPNQLEKGDQLTPPPVGVPPQPIFPVPE